MTCLNKEYVFLCLYLFFSFIKVCVWGCFACMHICASCGICSALRGQRKALCSPGSGVTYGVSRHVDAGSGTWVRVSHWASSSPSMLDFYIYLFARKLIIVGCAALFIFFNICSAAVVLPETQIWFSPPHSQAFPFLLCVNHTLFADPLLTGAWWFLGFWHYKDILQ